MNIGTRLLGFCLAGLVAALSIANHFLHFFRRSPGVQGGLWLGLGVVCAAGFYLLERWSARWQGGASGAARLTWFAACLATGALPVLLIPGFTPLPPRLHTLEIRASGEKNPASAGSEVRLLRLLVDQEPLDFHELDQRGIWQISPREMLSDGPQPASLLYRFRYPAGRSLQAVFAAGPASGEVVVSLDRVARQVDLYAPQADTKRSIPVPVPALDAPDPGWTALLYTVDIFTLGLLLFLLIPGSPWLERRLPAGYLGWLNRLMERLLLPLPLQEGLSNLSSLDAPPVDPGSSPSPDLSLRAERSNPPSVEPLSSVESGSPPSPDLSLRAERGNPPSVGPLSSTKRGASLWLVVLVNLAVVIAVLYLFEAGLRLLDPAHRLPPNGPVGGPVGGQLYTWGNPVLNNSYGFREREWTNPKPAGVCRIMALGDSLTWGQGLAVEQRYTNVLEGLLQARFPQKTFEVLNFGVQGLPTTQERDILRKYKDRVQPDQVVVGFCYNDPQPHSQEYVVERVLFDQNHPLLANGLPDFLERVGLVRLAAQYRAGLGVLGQRLGLFPDWPVGVERTYDPGSKEWQAFVGALGDIQRMSAEAGLPPPLFAVLSEGSYPDRPVNLDQPDSYQQYILSWYARAEAAARQAGFQAFVLNPEIARAFATQPMAVNFLDGHPNAEANRIYAQKIFEVLAAEIERGELCR